MPFETDIFTTNSSEIKVTFIGHASLLLEVNGKSVYIDPVGIENIKGLAKADVICVTHVHLDHFDHKSIDSLTNSSTKIFMPYCCSDNGIEGSILNNDQVVDLDFVKILAVPAYNIKHRNKKGNIAHPKGWANGYIITLDGMSFYFSSDTENVPEMKDFPHVDVGFMRITFPMDKEMALDAVKMVNPNVLYPYHFGDHDIEGLMGYLKPQVESEFRLRSLA